MFSQHIALISYSVWFVAISACYLFSLNYVFSLQLQFNIWSCLSTNWYQTTIRVVLDMFCIDEQLSIE